MFFIGILSSFGAAVIWAGCFGSYRQFGTRLSALSLNLLKTTIGFLGVLISICVLRPEPPADPQSWIYLAASGVVGLGLGDIALLKSLKYLSSQSASILFCLTPIFTIVIGYFFLGETLTFFESLGIFMTLVSVLGVLYFNRDPEVGVCPKKSRGALIGVTLGVLSALLNASGVVLARRGFQGTDSFLGAGIRLGPALLILLLISLFKGETRKSYDEILEEPHFDMLVITAIMGTFVAIVLAAVGTKFLKAGLASTLTCSVPIWTVPIGRVFFNERVRPLATVCMGVSLIGLFLIFSG